MTKGFHHFAEPEELQKFLIDLGLQIQQRYSLDGLIPTGFVVPGTSVEVSYDISRDEETVAFGWVSLHENTPDKGQSRELYSRLYSRFGKPKTSLARRKWLSSFTKLRSFQSNSDLSEICAYLVSLGYEPEEYFSEGGQKYTGLTLLRGTIRVSDNFNIDETDNQSETTRIGLDLPMRRNTPPKDSIALYEELFRTFHRS